MKRRNGFTLVELLAVIVVLAIILAVAVPGISGVIKSSTKASFSSDAKLVLKAVDYKMLEDENFDISLIDKTNIKSLLNVSDENYSSVDFAVVNDVLYVKLVGQGKWAGLTACGVYKNMNVIEEGVCGPDFNAPEVTYSPDGSSTYIKSSTVTITVVDENIDASSLKYVWTNSATQPADGEYTTSFTSGSAINMPNNNGDWYLHVMARDLMNNVTRISKLFKLDNEKPVLTLNGTSTVRIGLGSTYSDAGATATDNFDTGIQSKIVVTGTVNPNATGTYTLTYNVSDVAGNTATQITRTVTVIQAVYTFSYTGNYQTWTVPETGTYKLEVWGAEGGPYSAAGGKGGYSSGNKALTSGGQIYIYVGQKGESGTVGGWNGGGTGDYYSEGAGGTGGGATDIRSGGTALGNRIIVAGGGGGGGYASSSYVGGAGGGTYGVAGVGGNYGGGGTQSSGGTSSCTAGTLGVGGSCTRGGYGGAGGGGGGYYGGGAGYYSTGGGGGSGYIGGVNNGQTIAGNGTIPNPSGGTMVGNSGNGYARITFVSQ